MSLKFQNIFCWMPTFRNVTVIALGIKLYCPFKVYVHLKPFIVICATFGQTTQQNTFSNIGGPGVVLTH